jgi:alpha/beta superfamily hydrolase
VALGYCAMRLNFRGVGESDGVFDEGRGEVEDFLALAGHARTTYGDGELAIGGFSFGGYVAAAAAAKLQPAQLVLAAPAVGRFPVGHVPGSTLVVHGEEDDVVPLKDVLNWARPQALPVVVFPGAGHFFHGGLVALQRLVERHCRP